MTLGIEIITEDGLPAFLLMTDIAGVYIELCGNRTYALKVSYTSGGALAIFESKNLERVMFWYEHIIIELKNNSITIKVGVE